MRKGIIDKIIMDRPLFLLVLLFLIFIIFSAIIPRFFSVYNIFNMSKYGVEIGLLALAETLVIISGGGGIDLSVGSMMTLATVFLGHMTIRMGINVWIASIGAICGGALLGLINGALINFTGILPLIVTLSTMYAFNSIALVISGGMPMPGVGDTLRFPESFFILGQSELFGGIPFQVIVIFIPITLLLWFLLSRTVFGRYLYAVGSNSKAAHFAAIRVNYVRLWVYVASGTLAGVAAVVKASRVASASPDAGLGTELQAITIAVLGGVNIMGGEGKVAGTFLSIAIITMIYNGLDLGGVHSIWQIGTLGLILIFSVLLNQFLIRRRGE